MIKILLVIVSVYISTAFDDMAFFNILPLFSQPFLQNVNLITLNLINNIISGGKKKRKKKNTNKC